MFPQSYVLGLRLGAGLGFRGNYPVKSKWMQVSTCSRVQGFGVIGLCSGMGLGFGLGSREGLGIGLGM